jgi:NAD(P)-dependent dehydrogenase (short-subunit alcohol dehydrogenase family)
MNPGRGTMLVTGASSGIGAATARQLVDEGFRVFGTSRQSAPPGPGIEWLLMDVTDDDSVDAGVREVAARAGSIEGLVCAAGYGVFGSIEETSLARARDQFDTNVLGVVRLLRAVLPGMRERGKGRVVVVGSLAGRAPIPFQAHYSASKAALEALTLTLRNELHGTGVFASLVEPGDIRTAFNERMDWGEGGPSAYGGRIAKCEQVIRESLPRAPGPEIVARVIARALNARRPRVRYCVGPDSRLVPWGRRLLPDAICLALIRDHFRV